MFSKKKKKDGLDLDDEEDFDEESDEEEDLSEDDSEKNATQEEIEKNFVFEIEGGCPICGGLVRGNAHYKYFCKDCNVLFGQKDIVSEDDHFLNKDAPAPRKKKLSSEEKTELEKKRRILKDKIYDEFSEKKKQELKLAAEERAEEKDEEPLEASEPVPVSDKYVEEGSGDGEDIVEHSRPAHVTDINDILNALGSTVREAEIVSEEHEESADSDAEEAPAEKETASSGLEPGRIIASTQSKKLHEGSCHFVKKIQKDKRVYFNTIEAGTAEGYEPCVCLRRMIAKENSKR